MASTLTEQFQTPGKARRTVLRALALVLALTFLDPASVARAAELPIPVVPAVATVPAVVPPIAPAVSAATQPAARAASRLGMALGRGRALAGRLFRGTAARLNPARPYNTLMSNYAAGRYYATDLSVHGSIRAAFQRSFKPTNVGANVMAALKSKIHPARLMGALTAPLTIRLSQQLASGHGLDFVALARSFNPMTLGMTFAGGVLGEVGGAAVQSLLARTGTVGAVAGLFVKPLISFTGYLAGMNLGENLHGGEGIRTGMAKALRDLQPLRDLGQIFGYAIGSTVGQILLPIPVLGGIFPGLLIGTIGAWLGGKAATSNAFGGVDRWMKGGLDWLASGLDGGRPPSPIESQSNAPANPARSVELVPSYDSLTPRVHVHEQPTPPPPHRSRIRAPANSGLDNDDLRNSNPSNPME